VDHDWAVEPPAARLVWKNGQSWAGIKTHIGCCQEAHDAERATPARALETASRRQAAPERVAIFAGAQAAVRQMASEEPVPGQMYALQARKHIAVLRRRKRFHTYTMKGQG